MTDGAMEAPSLAVILGGIGIALSEILLSRTNSLDSIFPNLPLPLLEARFPLVLPLGSVVYLCHTELLRRFSTLCDGHVPPLRRFIYYRYDWILIMVIDK